MKILDKREHPGLATLYLASLSGEDRVVEFVDTVEPGIAKSEKWVMMISTQVGCPVGCRMCDAGALGYFGNLRAEEMLAQIRHIIAANPQLNPLRHPKLKIHFARMGEPSLNPETLKALKILAEEYPHSGIIPSLSTVAPQSPAIEPFFEELMKIKDSSFPGGRFQLQFSLHSLDEGARRVVVPIKTWALEKIAEYGMRFVRPGDRKITLNFALAQGEGIDAAKARRLFSPKHFLIKITPINPTRTADRNGATRLWSSAPGSIAACADSLRSGEFEVILSPSLPEEISASTSCGQLWSEDLQQRADAMARNCKREETCYITAGNLGERSRYWQKEIAGYHKHNLKLNAPKAGLLVVDMQEFFLSPRSPAYRPQARAVLSHVGDLVKSFRRANRPVIFVRHAHMDPLQDGGMMRFWWKKVCVDGTHGARVAPLLEAREDEILRKCRYSAFSEPRLEKTLRAKSVENLVVAGVMTNLCVESTVRDAFDAGFKVWTVLDATAAHTEELHLASLKSLAFGFSSIQTTREILEALDASTEAPITVEKTRQKR
jgi:23S rRNA (adenine2503-C2)-methyltransferase